MKKLLVTLGLATVAAGAFAQGTVNFVNAATTSMRTNATAPNAITGTNGTIGNTGPALGGFYYEVLTAPSTAPAVDSSLQGLLSGPWSDTQLRGTNTAFATGGRMTGGSGATVQNWVGGGAMQSYYVVAWSAIEGTTWAQVALKLQGATLSPDGRWQGGLLVDGGFVGGSARGNAISGGGAFPAFSLFSGSSAQGTGISTTTDLFIVAPPIPETSTFALVGLGSAALLIFRRRK